jgi:hypothetical protein
VPDGIALAAILRVFLIRLIRLIPAFRVGISRQR